MSLVTKHYENCYYAANPPIFGTSMPWTPEATITEGMFLINTTSLNTHNTLSDCCKFLMQRFVICESNSFMHTDEFNHRFYNYVTWIEN